MLDPILEPKIQAVKDYRWPKRKTPELGTKAMAETMLKDEAQDRKIADLERRVAALETELRSRPAAPKCAECGGSGQVSRSWGYIPCDACGGKGF